MKHTHGHAGLMETRPSFHANLGFPLNSPSPYIFFNTIPPHSSHIGEGMAVKEEEWRESTFHEGEIGTEILRLDAIPVAN